jgi:two-component system sensor histidine kinase CiaH
MILNLLAFTIIFAIFGIIIFSQVQNTLYSKTDEELSSFKNKIANHPSGEMKSPMPNNDVDPTGPPNRRQKNPNPRIMVVDWSEDGQILNKDEIGTLFYENYLQDYQLDKTTIDQVTMTRINDLYDFRYILIEDTNEGDEIAYTQLMINVDPEQLILNNFGKLIIICSVIFIVLSISASYILSKKNDETDYSIME